MKVQSFHEINFKHKVQQQLAYSNWDPKSDKAQMMYKQDKPDTANL